VDGIARAVGEALGALPGHIANVIGGGLRALVAIGETALPGPLLPIAVVGALLGLAWLIRR
jgi:hypothetical protein